jgi:hypothetical protein
MLTHQLSIRQYDAQTQEKWLAATTVNYIAAFAKSGHNQ